MREPSLMSAMSNKYGRVVESPLQELVRAFSLNHSRETVSLMAILHVLGRAETLTRTLFFLKCVVQHRSPSRGLHCERHRIFRGQATVGNIQPVHMCLALISFPLFFYLLIRKWN